MHKWLMFSMDFRLIFPFWELMEGWWLRSRGVKQLGVRLGAIVVRTPYQ